VGYPFRILLTLPPPYPYPPFVELVPFSRLTHCFAQTVTIETRLLLPANPPSMKSNINSAVEYKNLELIGGIVVTSPSLHTQ